MVPHFLRFITLSGFLKGEDSVENAIALCPNCHREAHYGALELVVVNKQD
ncbi:HNH endonuclease [Citrobacter freundii]